MFGKDWQRIEGVVVAEAIHKQHPSGDGQWYTRMKYVIQYERPGAGVERVELKEPERFGAKVISSLTKGDAVPLLIDPKSEEVRFDTDDPRINLRARIKRDKRRDEDEFERALKG